MKLRLRLAFAGLAHEYGEPSLGFSACPSFRKKTKNCWLFLLFLHTVSSTALSSRVELLYMCDTFCIRLRFQRSHTVPCFLVGFTWKQECRRHAPLGSLRQRTHACTAMGVHHHVQQWLTRARTHTHA